MYLGGRRTSDPVRIALSDRSKGCEAGESAGSRDSGNLSQQLRNLRSCGCAEYVWSKKHNNGGDFKCDPCTDV